MPWLFPSVRQLGVLKGGCNPQGSGILCDNPQFPYKEPTYIVVGVSGVLRTDEIHRELGRQIAPDVIQPISVLNRKFGKFVMKAIGEIWPTEKVGPIRTYLAMFCKKRTESEADAPSNPELPVIR